MKPFAKTPSGSLNTSLQNGEGRSHTTRASIRTSGKERGSAIRAGKIGSTSSANRRSPQYRTLELQILREIENNEKLRADFGYKFDSIISDINSLLPLVEIVRTGGTFNIRKRTDGTQLQPDQISSGESEAIALAIEALVFSRESQAREKRALLIDEPDVHLHPDLQARFIRFLARLAKEKDFKIVIPTHSTALVGSVEDKDEVQLAFMPLSTDNEISFSPINEIVSAVVPIFGAHPLSNIFNEAPILIVEGDDDTRIWSQVVRSNQGKFSVWPCSAGSIDEIGKWEQWLAEKLPSLYDEPKAFSLRDRDDAHGQLDDLGSVVRLRLECRAAENLLLANETLSLAKISWEQVIEGCKRWLETYGTHPKRANMQAFADTNFNRFDARLKEIRNILLAVIGVSRPWEVLVGQSIAELVNADAQGNAEPEANSLRRLSW
jgi:AAA domain, putative AbiEii toxin, Type IV TA system